MQILGNWESCDSELGRKFRKIETVMYKSWQQPKTVWITIRNVKNPIFFSETKRPERYQEMITSLISFLEAIVKRPRFNNTGL